MRRSMRTGPSDATPADSEEFQLLLDAAVALPDAGIDEAEGDVVVLIGRGGTICLGDVLVHRARAHRAAVEVLLLGGRDEVVDRRAAALDLTHVTSFESR